MKILNKTGIAILTAVVLTSTFSCKKLLEEKPRAALYPDYFSTAGGIQAAVTGVYQDLRNNLYAGEPVHWYSGTDEHLMGSQQTASGQPLALMTYNGLNSSNTVGFGGLWADINTLNGVIQYATASTTLDAAKKGLLIGQAKFLRGYIYFYLVQTYGGVTATQKSGIPLHLTFLTEASTADAPAQLADIYNQIIQDFTEAAAGLPNTITSTNPFSNAGVGKTATAAVAKAYLAKAYLTRGYTEAKVATDFTQAATITQELINNKATYGLDLWQDYNDAHKEANDYGKENMFGIDYGFGTTDSRYNGYTQGGSGGWGLNALLVLQRWNYISNAGIDNVSGVDAVPQKIGGPSPMQRDVYNGRPYGRLVPNPSYVQKVFNDANQVRDTRFDATFQTFWINNVNVRAGRTSTGGNKPKLTSTSNFSQTVYGIPVDGDTAILMPNAAQSAATNMARRDAFPGLIVTQAQWSNAIAPTVKKFDDTRRIHMNDFSGRPIMLMRFSEVYLMNAEANYMAGTPAGAVTSLNVLRTRAAFRVPADGNQIPKGQFRVTTANQAAMNAANALANQLSPAEIALLSVPNNTTDFTNKDICGMDVILDEYTRENYGEARRWYDLVRTQQLVRRVKLYNAAAANNVQTYHMRRPIPQSLIDQVLTGPKYPQNNGY
ncbi:MAG: RagB/SusD family nutrient uptake outer membrane protein [Sphingobacteriaceae bacterium]|nr:MAG: RagB/SusD family nutrient uptake outer membrane protein [Sphingobacteriaceae bacterium]